MQQKYKAKLRKKQTIANDTMAFYWEKPHGFTYKAGQYCTMTLINPKLTDEEGKERALSIATAPYEEAVMTATRISDSAFKQMLEEFTPGTEVEFDEPRGEFTLHHDETTPAVFIIGGIGITPVRSIIAQATNEQFPHNLILLYSNKKPQDAAFMEDLKGFEEKNSNFLFVPVMTNTEPNEWTGERGLIDTDMIQKYVSDISAPIYYLCGPPKMVKDMHQLLVEMGVDENNIRVEEFSGY
ncbi:FAD-dependent oxidoreductase [Aquibacillus albus]|uniref:Ferredoxin-NADP reductase n=1 Tax=Aquibacillus albus TaxID=1168171 RepID=A0ABS2MVT6_9BACI|nr:FAD-dependent oxidoreductase [Aquibacillus albus]MBM7569903.1 ferredoxin-NADP reductase [Aquibacillus albus]